jgi:hypothetical protein
MVVTLQQLDQRKVDNPFTWTPFPRLLVILNATNFAQGYCCCHSQSLRQPGMERQIERLSD